MIKVKTPDNNSFEVKVVSKIDANIIEKEKSTIKLDSALLEVNNRRAFLLENGEVLYRQYNNGSGLLFKTIYEYKIAIRGESYFDTNFQLAKDGKLYVGFMLRPLQTNSFKGKILREINEYQRYEGWTFFLLDDSSVLMTRDRTGILSDGYWFESLSNFDHFYFILSGIGE